MGLDRVIYVGGDQKQLGWRRRYVLDDPDGGRRGTTNIDSTTGQRYNNKHDGFNGFTMRKMLDNLVRCSNPAHKP